MKLASSRPTTQTERIFALEEARKADGERLDKIETMVGEIHSILVKARGFKWVLDGFFQICRPHRDIVRWAGYGAWRFFTGH
jgi:hypothetical protein